MSDRWDEVIERERRKTPGVLDSNVVPLHGIEGEALLPAWDAPYKAASHVESGSLTRLVCILGREHFRDGGDPYRLFQYVHLDSNNRFGFTHDDDGQVLQRMIFSFVGYTPVRIIVRGRNLLRICDYIHLHRIAWIRVSDPERDFEAVETADTKAEIITDIAIVEGKEAF